MHILLLEDDHLMIEALDRELRRAFGQSRLTLESVRSELEFRRRLPQLRVKLVDVAVLDVMVQWMSIDSEPLEAPAKDDPAAEGHHRAGLRCASGLRNVGFAGPIVLYTVLQHEDLASDLEQLEVIHVPKNAPADRLVSKIREALTRCQSR